MSVVKRVLVNSVGQRFLNALFITRHYSTEKSCIQSNIPDIDIPKTNITDFLFNKCGRWHDKIAFECGITGRKYTFDDLRIKSTNLSKALRKIFKLQKDDVVALLLPNIPEFPICTFGIILAGLKLTTINPIYPPEEIGRQLKDAHPRVIITLTELNKNAKAALQLTNIDIPVITIKTDTSELTPPGAINFQELTEKTFDIADTVSSLPDDTVFLPYSSGTTGFPKGVELSNYNLIANVLQFNALNPRFAEDATDTHQDVLPAVLPFFHIYGFTMTLLNSVYAGVKTVTLPQFKPDVFVNTITQHKPQLLMVVPPIVLFLCSHPSVKTEYFQNMRTLMCGAAPLGALDEEKLRQKVGKPFNMLQGYGLSEASPGVLMVPTTKPGMYPGSIGHPVANTSVKVINIDDTTAKHLGPNKIGELIVKGPQVMKGYYNKTQETKDAFLDGWLRTGDLVHYDENEMFFIADRIKELIKVKGYQVPPAELEELIRDFPTVAEAAVIGIPHEHNGEAPRAYVVPKVDSTVDVKKLQSHVDGKVAPYKRLVGGIAVVDSIPKNASGKILRRQLKLKYEAERV